MSPSDFSQTNILDFPSKITSEDITDIEITNCYDGKIEFKFKIGEDEKGEEMFEYRILHDYLSCLFKGVSDLHVGQKFKLKSTISGNSMIMSLIQFPPDIENAIIAHA